MSLIARLRAYASDALGLVPRGEAAGGPDLAAVALLVHVARVDGVLAPAESERLVRIVQGRYAPDAESARALIARASAVDTETRDVASLVEMIPHGADAGADLAEREALLAMAWSVAGADGVVDEFEEALVWRLGRLLRFDEAAITAARQQGLAAEARAAAS